MLPINNSNDNPSTCPKCSSTSKYRIKRKGLSRYMPGAKDYVCDNCNKRYTVVKLSFFWKFSI